MYTVQPFGDFAPGNKFIDRSVAIELKVYTQTETQTHV